MISLDSLSIELTRRCNMECEHCLRGEPQNMDLNPAHVSELFGHLTYISSLTLTGGEPSLRPDLIEHIADIGRDSGVGIGNFYIATNGKKVSDEFLMAVLKLYLTCEENDYSELAVSVDNHHEEIPPENLKRVKAFQFGGLREISSPSSWRGIIDQGRAEGWGDRELSPEEFEIDDWGEDDTRINGTLYLNVHGQIIAGCDWSYDNQPEHFICHANEFSLERMEEFIDANTP